MSCLREVERGVINGMKTVDGLYKVKGLRASTARLILSSFAYIAHGYTSKSTHIAGWSPIDLLTWQITISYEVSTLTAGQWKVLQKSWIRNRKPPPIFSNKFHQKAPRFTFWLSSENATKGWLNWKSVHFVRNTNLRTSGICGGRSTNGHPMKCIQRHLNGIKAWKPKWISNKTDLAIYYPFNPSNWWPQSIN